jgi:hypothetical protein
MIRFFTGFILMLGAVGSIENENASLMTGMALAALGLILMAWTVIDGTMKRYDA